MMLQNLKHNKWIWLIVVYTIAMASNVGERSTFALIITVISGVLYFVLFYKPKNWSISSKVMILTPFFLLPSAAFFVDVGNLTAAGNTVLAMIIIIVITSRAKKAIDARNRFLNGQKKD